MTGQAVTAGEAEAIVDHFENGDVDAEPAERPDTSTREARLAYAQALAESANETTPTQE